MHTVNTLQQVLHESGLIRRRFDFDLTWITHLRWLCVGQIAYEKPQLAPCAQKHNPSYAYQHRQNNSSCAPAGGVHALRRFPGRAQGFGSG